MTNIEKVQAQLKQRDLLEQLAEECNELSKAALKFIRAAKMSKNYTPVSVIKAEYNILEELSDVLMCAMALGLDIPTEEEIRSNPKWERWAKRLESAE